MSNTTPNIPKSFAALILGNVIAIIFSSVISLLICQSFFPVFFQQFLERGRAVKALEELESNKVAKEGDQQKKESNDKEKQEGDIPQKPAAKESEREAEELDEDALAKLKEIAEKPLEFPFGCAASFFVCDMIFAAIAGCVCVWIAGNSKFSHALLLALLIAVFKFQALLGFVENQIPKTLLSIELIAAPLACIFGASFQFEPPNSQPDDDQYGEGLNRAFDSDEFDEESVEGEK